MKDDVIWMPLPGTGDDCPFTEDVLRELNEIAQRTIADGRTRELTVRGLRVTARRRNAPSGTTVCELHVVREKIGTYITALPNTRNGGMFFEKLPGTN